MRVTINFDVAVPRAKAAMKALILAESEYISEALVRLANVNSENAQAIATDVSESLEQVVVQLVILASDFVQHHEHAEHQSHEVDTQLNSHLIQGV